MVTKVLKWEEIATFTLAIVMKYRIVSQYRKIIRRHYGSVKNSIEYCTWKGLGVYLVVGGAYSLTCRLPEVGYVCQSSSCAAANCSGRWLFQSATACDKYCGQGCRAPQMELKKTTKLIDLFYG
jgi:hypothetical protein